MSGGVWSLVMAQVIPELDFNQFKGWLNKKNDTVYVVNFWATWCRPCVEELPGFTKAASELKEQKVKFIFVSLDFPDQNPGKLTSFVKKHQMEGRTLLLNDPDSNAWIPRVDSGWSGAIPATLIYKGADRSFYERPLSYHELLNTIKIKQP